MLTNEVTRDNLHHLVLSFYTKVLNDDIIGVIFRDTLGDDLNSTIWQEHIELITDFWASVALGDLKYNGSPLTPHIKLKERLSIKAFEQWLKLFFETLNTIYEPQLAQLFLAKSKTIAGNFIRNLELT